MGDVEEVQIDVGRVLEITRIKLQDTTNEAIMLRALAAQQSEEIAKLKKAIDAFAESQEDENGS